MTEALTPCPLCGTARSGPFPMYYLFNGKRFEARKCARCHFIFIAPRPTPEELRLMYSDEYFLFDGSDFGAHASTDYETAAIRGSVKFPAILGAIQKFKPSGKFFEIGCGMGYFLNYANTHGYEASGIEFAALGTEACRTKFGLDVTQSSFEDWRSAPNTYDVIFMGDVLEHFVDPVPMLEKANGMLKPGGVIAAEVPAVFNSLIGRAAAIALKAMNKPRKMQMPPYHVNEFTPATLRNMLEQSGYTNVKIIQRVKAPSTITLRGNAFDRAIKKSLQYPNYFLTTTFGVFGDRMLGIGIK